MKPKCHFSESFLHRQGGKLWAWLQGSVEERIMEIIKQRKAGQQPGSRQEAEEGAAEVQEESTGRDRLPEGGPPESEDC